MHCHPCHLAHVGHDASAPGRSTSSNSSPWEEPQAGARPRLPATSRRSHRAAPPASRPRAPR
eukprot:1721125-Pyramimonas_sp.AAC.1